MPAQMSEVSVKKESQPNYLGALAPTSTLASPTLQQGLTLQRSACALSPVSLTHTHTHTPGAWPIPVLAGKAEPLLSLPTR